MLAPAGDFFADRDFFHLRIITGDAFLYYARMKFQWRPCRLQNSALYLCLIVTAAPGLAESADDAESSAGYICVPSTSGQGWDCDEDLGQKPLLPKRVAKKEPKKPVSPAAQIPLETQSSEVRLDPNIDPTTGLSLDPDDWYTPTTTRPVQPDHQLVEDLPATLYVTSDDGGFCPGGYRQRDFPLDLSAANKDYPIVTMADQLSAELGVSAELSGNVTIEQGNLLILTNLAQLDYSSRIAEFPAGVRMDQPGMVLQGGQATVNLNSSEADLRDVQFLLTGPSLRGEAASMAQNSSGDLTLSKNRFTRCEPGSNGWSLVTKELVIEKGEVFGTAKHAVLRLKSVPIFYTPYLKFPVSDQRVSGFLFPNMGYSDEDGTDVSIPYYFNLAPNYDATLIPRYLSKRGTAAELELRHMASWQSTTLSGALLPNDDLYNGRIDREDFDDAGGEAVFGPFDTADRWLGAMQHQGRIGPFRTLVDYTSVSDRDYFRDLGSDLGVSSRRELERKGEIRYNSGGLSMRLWAQRFQRLDEVLIDDYQRLPELDLGYARTLLGPLEISLGGKWSEFERDTDGLNGLAAVTGRRIHLEPRVKLPFSWPAGFLTFSGGLRHTEYELEQDNDAGGAALADHDPVRNIGIGSIDGGLFFERELNWFGQDMIQTLEPRVYYLWQEFEEQSDLPRFDASRLTFGYSQLFRENRFSGLDRISDANQVSTGVTTRFVSAASGREYFRFSVGEIFYFDDREVTLAGAPGPNEQQRTSAIAAEMSAALIGNWRVSGNIVWDPNDNQVDEGGAAIQYRRDNRHIFNVGYRNRFDEDIEQTDVSLYWPLTDHLAVLGRWNYDLVSGRTVEGFGGVEYNNCCLKIRLVARHFLDSPTARNFENVEADDGVFLQIVFKGLAGFGTKVESVLERGIRGYRAPQQQDY